MAKKKAKNQPPKERNLLALWMILHPTNAARREPNKRVKASRNACRKPVKLDD